MKKLCPILMSNCQETFEKRCVADTCAWWDPQENKCVVFSVLDAVQKITDNGYTTLDEINKTLKSK